MACGTRMKSITAFVHLQTLVELCHNLRKNTFNLRKNSWKPGWRLLLMSGSFKRGEKGIRWMRLVHVRSWRVVPTCFHMQIKAAEAAAKASGGCDLV